MRYIVRSIFLSLLLAVFVAPGISHAAVSPVFLGENETVSRGDFLQWSVEALQLDTTNICTTTFKRIPPPLTGVICAASKEGALNIWKNNPTLLLHQPITRIEAAEILTALTHKNSSVNISALRDLRGDIEKKAAMNAIGLKWIMPLRKTIFGSRKNLTALEAYNIISTLNNNSDTTTPVAPTENNSPVLPNSTLLNAVWNIIQKDYLRSSKIDTSDVSYKSIEGLVQSLKDPYTIFFRPSQANDFESQIKGQLNGAIGAHVEMKDGFATIVAPLSGSPAEKAGLKPGDRILSANGKTLSGMILDDVVSQIRGEKGTTVTLIIQRDGQNITIPVVRDNVSIPDYEVSWKGNIAIVKLSQFGDNADQTIRDVFSAIALKHPLGIILDMRNNPGGLLHGAIEVASNFVPKGSPIVQVKSKTDSTTQSTLEDPTIDPSTPLVLLVNKGSASASEIMAGAMKDLKRATIVGTGTFGKGTVQEFINFQSGEALKLTVAEFLSPYGNKIDGTGVQPDIFVDTLPTDTTDAQMDRALKVFQ